MGFKCGIVGLPNVGKSTLFNALTKAKIAAENYPFCTIDPNVGVVPVPDPRLNHITAIVKPKQVVPTTVEFVDIAGLVAGAAKGEGLGNQFLAHIRETQAIAHVVRCFVNDDIAHVSGAIDPLRDVETINTELALADLQTATKALNKIMKSAKGGDKKLLAEKQILEKLVTHLDNGNPVRTAAVANEEVVAELHLLTDKPVLYIANVAEDGLTNNPYLAQLQEHAAKEKSEVVPICAAIEAEIAELQDAEKLEFLHELGLEEPGLNRVIRAGYALLGLLTFFTAGPKEARAWTVRNGALAPEAAGAIHTDFTRGFIRAEVIAYDDFVANNGDAGAKAAGKLRVEGKDYVVKDGDVMLFRFNV